MKKLHVHLIHHVPKWPPYSCKIRTLCVPQIYIVHTYLYMVYIYIYIYIKIKHKVKWMVKFVKTLDPLIPHTFLPQYIEALLFLLCYMFIFLKSFLNKTKFI